MQALPSPSSCCSPCEDQPTTQIPGPQGEPGTDGTNGSDGISAFTDLTSAFTQPAVSATDDADVANSDWAVVGQIVFLEGGGYYAVTAVPDSTTITLENLGYTANSAPATVIASGSHVGPAGEKGQDGATGGGDMLYADNLNAMANNDTSLANLGGTVAGLGFFKITSPSAVTFPRINADNTVTARTAADLRTDIGLGTMATQAASAVAITGGTLNGTLGATTPASAVVTTLSASGATTLNGAATLSGITTLNGVTTAASKLFLTTSAIQSLLAATAINPNAIKIRVAGNGGAVTMITTPTITTPAADGQLLIIQGTDGTNTVTLQDEGGLAGTQLELGAATRLLGLGDTIGLLWDAATSKWYELFFTNN